MLSPSPRRACSHFESAPESTAASCALADCVPSLLGRQQVVLEAVRPAISERFPGRLRRYPQQKLRLHSLGQSERTEEKKGKQKTGTSRRQVLDYLIPLVYDKLHANPQGYIRMDQRLKPKEP
jgi:hypothetical protein